MVLAGVWWAWAVTTVHRAVEDFARTGNPWFGQVELAPGTHTLWVEGDCMSCRGNEPAEYRAAATVQVVGPQGRPVDLEAIGADWVFNTSGREGRALYTFTVERAGTHRIAFDLEIDDDWDNRMPSNLAIGQGEGLPVRIVRPMALLAGGGALTGAVLAALTNWRRRRWFDAAHRTDRRSERPPPGGTGDGLSDQAPATPGSDARQQ